MSEITTGAMEYVYDRDKDLITSIQESMEVEFLNEYYKVNNKMFTGDINVYGGNMEGPIPHFHVTFKDRGTLYESCLAIFEAKYANHEEKHVRMNNDRLFGINVFLMSPDKNVKELKEDGTKYSYWDSIVRMWVLSKGDLNFDHKYDWKTIHKPNYRLTKDCIKMGDKYNHSKAPII